MKDSDIVTLQKKRGDNFVRGPILHSVEVRGKNHCWLIDTYITRQNAQEWRDDGLLVNEIINRIPAWWVNYGLPVRFYCFWQDVFHFKNPWADRPEESMLKRVLFWTGVWSLAYFAFAALGMWMRGAL